MEKKGINANNPRDEHASWKIMMNIGNYKFDGLGDT
jgi:hypothetical protein